MKLVLKHIILLWKTVWVCVRIAAIGLGSCPLLDPDCYHVIKEPLTLVLQFTNFAATSKLIVKCLVFTKTLQNWCFGYIFAFPSIYSPYQWYLIHVFLKTHHCLHTISTCSLALHCDSLVEHRRGKSCQTVSGVLMSAVFNRLLFNCQPRGRGGGEGGFVLEPRFHLKFYGISLSTQKPTILAHPCERG